jgi:hypothetical protein
MKWVSGMLVRYSTAEPAQAIGKSVRRMSRLQSRFPSMSEPADSVAKRIRLCRRGVLRLFLLPPVTVPADAAGTPPPCFDRQAENHEIKDPLGGMTSSNDRLPGTARSSAAGRNGSAIRRSDPVSYRDAGLLPLAGFVRCLARGEPVNVAMSGAPAPSHAAGRQLFRRRFGQVDIACHHCHEYHAGRMFGGQVLSQGRLHGPLAVAGYICISLY